MTEQPTTPVTTEPTTEPTEVVDPLASVPESLRPFIAESTKFIEAQTVLANALAEKLIHAGNSAKLVHEYRDDAKTTDESILKYRAYIDQANNAILAAQAQIEKYILDNGLVDTTPINVEAVTEEHKAAKSQVVAMTKALAQMPGTEAVLGALTKLTAAPGARAGTSGASQTGVRRPRIASIEVNGVTVKDKNDKATITVLSQYLAKEYKGKGGEDVDATELRNAMFAAAGTEDLGTLNGTAVDFSYPVGAANVKIHVVPSVGK